MNTSAKPSSQTFFNKIFQKKYIPIYIIIVISVILITLLTLFLLMRQTDFAADTSIRNYFEGVGVVPVAENKSDTDETAAENGKDESSQEDGEETDEDSQDESDSENENEDDDTTSSPGTISTKYPTITSVKDGLGHTNRTSFGQENTGSASRYTITAENQLTITVTASNPNSSTLSYKYDYQLPGGSFVPLHTWSTSKTQKWTVPESAVGKWLYIKVSVKDADEELRFDGYDDYMYLIYEVKPKPVEDEDENTEIYPKITSSSDNKGNTNTTSWSEGGLNWSSPTFREVNAGESITFTILATDPNGDPLQYKFMLQPQGGSFETLRDWSSSNTFTWVIPNELKDQNIYIMASIKDNDAYLQFHDSGDDYNYMTYAVK